MSNTGAKRRVSDERRVAKRINIISGGIVTIGGRTPLTFHADDFKRAPLERISARLEFKEGVAVSILAGNRLLEDILVIRCGGYYRVEFPFVSIRFTLRDIRVFADAILEAQCASWEERDANAGKRRHQLSVSA